MTIDEITEKIIESKNNDIAKAFTMHIGSLLINNGIVPIMTEYTRDDVENIMLIYNANWYADEDDGVPDCEVLESIWNVIQDNGLDIDIEQDYRKGKSDGV